MAARTRKATATNGADPAVETIPLDELVPYEQNARVHSHDQVGAIAASLREFGWVNPVLIDAENNVIAGHGRIEAAKMINWTHAPCVRITHLTEPQRKAYVIADNRLAELGSWDKSVLAVAMADLGDIGLDTDITGFSQQDIGGWLVTGDAADPAEEWDGMPEFDQRDQMAFQTIKVHMANQAAVDEFSKLMKRKFTENTKFVWYPNQDIETYVDKRYKSGASDDAGKPKEGDA